MGRHIHLCNQSFNINQWFAAHWLVLVCSLCNCRLSLFWWSACQCLEPMYAQLLSKWKHRHRLEQHGDLHRRSCQRSLSTHGTGEKMSLRATLMQKWRLFSPWMSSVFQLYDNTCKPVLWRVGKQRDAKVGRWKFIFQHSWQDSPGVTRGRLNNSVLHSFWLLCNPDACWEMCRDHLAARRSTANLFHLLGLQRSEANRPLLTYERTSFLIFISPLKPAPVRGATPTVCLLPRTKHWQSDTGKSTTATPTRDRVPHETAVSPASFTKKCPPRSSQQCFDK